MPSSEVTDLNINPDIIFSRDVIIHQEKPFDFLSDLLSISSDLAIFRLRTKDKGKTILDVESSCQWYCNQWVPYMIFNTDELIQFIKEKVYFEKLIIYKNFKILGGVCSRYLPKDCYYPETGTSETAVGIKVSKSKIAQPSIQVKEVREIPGKLSIFEKKFGYLVKKLTSSI